MHRSAKALVLFLILALVTACTGSGSKGPIKLPQPGDKAGTDNTLTITKRNIYREGPANLGLEQGINVIDLAPGQEEVVVGRGEVMVTWELAQARNDHKERVRATGYMYDQLNTGGSEGSSTFVQAHFPAGAPERFEAWLDGVEGSKIVLVRKLEPTITIGLKLPGKELSTIEGLETSVPDGPFTLQFSFDQPMLEQSLAAMLSASGITGAKASWASDRRAVVEFTANPGRLDFKTQYFQATTGLLAVPRALVVRTASDAAYLERVNLSTGARELIMDLPSEIQRASLSPDGKYIAIEALEPQTNQGWWSSYLTVADLAGKKLVKPDLPGPTLDWRENKLVYLGLPQHGVVVWDPITGKRTNLGGPKFEGETALSPDGKWVASLERQMPQPGDPYEKTYPYTLVLTELATGKRTEADTNFINSWYFGKDGVDLSQRLTWSHDGQMLLALNPTDRNGAPAQLVAFDRRTGQKQILREMTNMSVWGRRLFPSPDGKYLITVVSDRSAVLIPLGAGQESTLAANASLSMFWDAAGARLLFADGDWDTVHVHSMSKGARQDLGKGLPAGWDGDWVYIVRWPGSDHRYIYQGI